MNYHIFPQDKFFDAYIEDIYKLRQEQSNVFWVRGREGDSAHFRTEKPVVYIGDDEESIIDKLKSINPNDKLFVSWYDLFIGDCVLKSEVPNRLYVYLMGGDFYNDPMGYHNYWLYDKYTKKIVDKFQFPQINLKRKPHNWGKVIKEIRDRNKFKEQIRNQYNEKLKTIGRIDYLVTGPDNNGEVELIKKLYPSFKGKYVYGSYDQNFDLAKVVTPMESHSGDKPLRVLLGNSADPTNNHIDACKFIIKTLPQNCLIFCPLSYGDSDYSVIFQRWAKQHLQARFYPILDFLNRKDYVELLNSMDVVIMFHNRQQAFGNIITSLCLGKPVFIKRNSPLFSLLKSMGIPDVYSIEMLNKSRISQMCESAYKNRSLTLSIIQDYYSEQARLNNLQKLII